ncbi:Rho termination factor [Flavobacteriaceae bacterium LYZ1037]|nr:Rho termination factor [Flavobacteriaceae bacterium LYZ1037]
MDIPSIENEAQYKALRDKEYSKEKAARIANTPNASKKGGVAKPYEEWTRSDLYQQAKKADINGRSKMDKTELIFALRNN